MIPVYKELKESLNDFKGNFGLWYNKFIKLNDNDSFKPYKEDVGKYKEKYYRLKDSIKDLLFLKHLQQYCFVRRFSSRYKIITFVAKLISPLIVGIGQTHPTEIGMTFDHALGIPYIPASSIKGVVRFAHLLEFIKDLPPDSGLIKKDTQGNEYIDEEDKSTNVPLLFGKGGDKGQRGNVIFLDSYPKNVPELRVDIQNPHYQEYYSEGKPPGDYLQPIPIKFLTVAKGTDFVFRVLVDKQKNNELETLTKKALKRALEQEGVGAKTALGYGRFYIEEEGELPSVIREYEKKYITKEEKIQRKKQALLTKIDTLGNAPHDVDSFVQQWQQDEDLKQDKDIAQKLKPKVKKKKKKRKEYTKSYIILAEVLGEKLD